MRENASVQFVDEKIDPSASSILRTIFVLAKEIVSIYLFIYLFN